jgi:hypothetical protein
LVVSIFGSHPFWLLQQNGSQILVVKFW